MSKLQKRANLGVKLTAREKKKLKIQQKRLSVIQARKAAARNKNWYIRNGRFLISEKNYLELLEKYDEIDTKPFLKVKTLFGYNAIRFYYKISKLYDIYRKIQGQKTLYQGLVDFKLNRTVHLSLNEEAVVLYILTSKLSILLALRQHLYYLNLSEIKYNEQNFYFQLISFTSVSEFIKIMYVEGNEDLMQLLYQASVNVWIHYKQRTFEVLNFTKKILIYCRALSYDIEPISEDEESAITDRFFKDTDTILSNELVTEVRKYIFSGIKKEEIRLDYGGFLENVIAELHDVYRYDYSKIQAVCLLDIYILIQEICNIYSMLKIYIE